MTIKIDKGVPLPTGWEKIAQRKYPFPEMEIGDSFFVPLEINKVGGKGRYWQHKLGFRYTMRSVKEDGQNGTRVWRIK